MDKSFLFFKRNDFDFDYNISMIVYRHVRLDKNEVFYIGIGSSIKRAYSRNRTKWWKNITDKTEYRVDILFDDLTNEQANDKEKELIELYGRRDLGLGTLVNMTDGGLSNYKLTAEHKEKLVSSLKGKPSHRKGKKLSEETKLKISLAKKGKQSNRKGKKHSEESILKMKIIKSSITEKTKLKISSSMKGKASHRKGKKLSEETRLKMSLAKIGNKNANKK